MYKNFFSFLLSVFVLGILLAPSVLFAQLVDETETVGGLVPCGNLVTKTDSNNESTIGKVANPCNFDYFILLINKVVDFAFKSIAVPIAAIMFCYAGFLLLFSGGNPDKMNKAKAIFINVAWGLVLIAGAWLIVKTVSDILGYKVSWIFG